VDAEQSAQLTGTNRPCGLIVSLRQTSKCRARDSDCENPAPLSEARGRSDLQVSGGVLEEATPDPIPNSEVKLLGADGTAREAVWESRTLPGLFESVDSRERAREDRHVHEEPAKAGSFFLSCVRSHGTRASPVAALSRVAMRLALGQRT
jgi:hypothetical protein